MGVSQAIRSRFNEFNRIRKAPVAKKEDEPKAKKLKSSKTPTRIMTSSSHQVCDLLFE